MAGQLIARGRGRWLVRAFVGRDEAGKRKYVSKMVRGTKQHARQELTKLLRERDTGTIVLPSRLTLQQLMRAWIASVRPRLRPRTVDDYEAVCRLYVRDVGHRRLSALSPVDLRRLYARLAARGLSPATVRKVHRIVHAALEHAVREGLVGHNVARRAADALPRIKTVERRVLTTTEAMKLIAALRAHRLGAFWLVLLTLGLRPSEALGLRWSDLDGDRLSVARALSERAGQLRFDEPKTRNGRRSLVLPPSIVEALEQHRRRQACERAQAGESYADQGLVFATRRGRPLRQANLHAPFKKLLRLAGLRPLRVYDLRHTTATALMGAAASPRAVAALLGHANAAFTMRTYVHAIDGMHRDTAERLEQLFFGSVPPSGRQTGTPSTR